MVASDESENPYQVSAATAVVLDLDGPVSGSATVRKMDWVRYYRSKGRLVGALLLGGLAILSLILWAMPAQASAELKGALWGAFLAIGLAWFVLRPKARVERNAAQMLIGNVDYRIDRLGIWIRHDDQIWETLWSGIEKLDITRNSLYVWADVASPRVLIPAKEIPAKELGNCWPAIKKSIKDSKHEILGSACLGNPRLVKDLAGTAPSDARHYHITLRGTHLQTIGEQYNASQKLPPRKRTSQFGLIVLVLLGLLAMLFVRGPARHIEPPTEPGPIGAGAMAMIAAPLVVLIILGILFWLTRMQANKQSSSDVIAEIDGWVSPSGLVQMGPTGWGSISWKKFGNVYEFDQQLLLKHESLNSLYFLRASDFESPDDWLAARTMIAAAIDSERWVQDVTTAE